MSDLCGCGEEIASEAAARRHAAVCELQGYPKPWVKRATRDNGCKIPGCHGRHNARGLCTTHYEQAQNAGTTWHVKTDDERFWEKVDKSPASGCWNWMAALNNQGYGQFSIKSRHVYAHRWSYCLANDVEPESIAGKVICHHCDNPRCVNPEHLFLGTQSDNGVDMMRKGRGGGQFKKQTHCNRGHEFTGDNLIVRSSGTRICRECQRQRSAAARAKRKAIQHRADKERLS